MEFHTAAMSAPGGAWLRAAFAKARRAADGAAAALRNYGEHDTRAAAAARDVEIFDGAMNVHGAAIEGEGGGLTPLARAASRPTSHGAECARELVALGADVNARCGACWQAPLHFAAAADASAAVTVGLALLGVRLATWTILGVCHQFEPCFDC
jgi:hypothetical protein